MRKPRTGPYMIRITDSHCHLDFPDFETELSEVVERAVAAGVHRMVTICTKLHQEPTVRAIAEAHDRARHHHAHTGTRRRPRRGVARPRDRPVRPRRRDR